ncbi:TetR/AcrR family transcriptional regulator [Plantactinospora sp. GCM10030261]|uniref:TetR/AcrR family transcriptional regulator n=1 Tax=Plantactinospora sp. GCM10030261 TaxID=3273420 RepID=UPI00361C66C9
MPEPWPPTGRPAQIVRAAFDIIADIGFEGLRVRDVATRVGINSATLHYHFATKEDLIRAVVEHAQARFRATMPAGGRPDEQLHAHLDAIRRLLAEEPELSRVLGEIAVRAQRDEGLVPILAATEQTWFDLLRDVLDRGVRAGCWTPDVDPAGAAALLMALVKGSFLPTTPTFREQWGDRAFAQLRRWIDADRGSG